MANGRTKNATLNILFSLLLQFVLLVRGLILPKIIIPVYGSELNGLFSSITQFLTYISLLEAGVGSIFRVSLYKPLAKGDMDEVSGIINEQKRFYRKIGFIFVFYVAVLCVIYPLIAKTDIEKPYIISCILILSVSTFAEQFLALPYVSLLSADQKIRISYVVNIIYNVLSVLVTLFWIFLKADIRLIYLSMSAIGLLRPLFFVLYVKKHYNLNKKAIPNQVALSQRWSGMVHHFSFYIHTNTDSAILTVFIGTAMVSVYNVYGAVAFGLEHVITSISNGIAAGLGDLIVSGDEKRINRTLDLFELVQGGITTVFYTIAALLLIPFVRIFTADMVDTNYIQPLFGYALIFSEAIYCFRCVYSSVSMNANKFKETQIGAVFECVVNLAASLFFVCVLKIGLPGVAIGTVFGMLVRLFFEVIYLSRDVVHRSVFKAIKMMLLSLAVAGCSVLFCIFLFDYTKIGSIATWLIYAIVTSVIVGIVAVVFYSVGYKTLIRSFVAAMLERRRRLEKN